MGLDILHAGGNAVDAGVVSAPGLLQKLHVLAPQRAADAAVLSLWL